MKTSILLYNDREVLAAVWDEEILESWGTGVSRMMEVCKAASVPEPKYGTDGLFVWITFQRPNSENNLDTNLGTNVGTNSNNGLHLSDRNKAILAFCIEPRSRREILEHIAVTSQQKNRERFINALVDAGFLERTVPESPNSPNQKYVTKKKVQ